MNVTRDSLVAILDACRFPSLTLVAWAMEMFHLSHHVQYNNSDRPIAVGEYKAADTRLLQGCILTKADPAVILLRIPRNSRSINVALRIRLHDLATVCFCATRLEDIGQDLLKRCSERSRLLMVHPLYFLVLIFEQRFVDYKEWFDKLVEENNVVESATGMTHSSWRKRLSGNTIAWFSDYDNLLRSIYASHTELSHFITVITFFIKFGNFLLETHRLIEDLRVEAGVTRMSKRDYESLHQRIQFSLSRCDMTSDKAKEIVERVKGQINVVSRHTG